MLSTFQKEHRLLKSNRLSRTIMMSTAIVYDNMERENIIGTGYLILDDCGFLGPYLNTNGKRMSAGWYNIVYVESFIAVTNDTVQ